ncbi:methylmalonyl-CoA mutase [Nitrospira defluvii]|nr:methylmalonyl-CoA mutase [Nitrospira defluvii]
MKLKRRERKPKFTNLSNIEIDPLYTQPPAKNLGQAGKYPYTRGIYPSMYRGQLWTMRQFSGFGSAKDTNKRYHYLMKRGQNGLSVAFDMPTLMGYDSDDPKSLGEVGKCGVAIDTVEDMARLFDKIPLDQVSTSMTVNGPAIILFAMYLVVAERQGLSFDQLRGTLQNDILKEYIAQKEWIAAPQPSLGLINDTIRFCVEEAPCFHPVSISGYHIREAGSTAVQELAFTLYNGLTYAESAVASGLKIDDFAPRLSFFFNAHNDFFEEIAKYRAARRLWAKEMKRRFHPRHPKSLALRFHTQTAGCTLTAQQPANNIVRVTLQALAAILGGTQSLHTNSMDETLALPSEEAVKIALRTQQIIAHESGVTNTIDPLGGSYYIEALTDRMEKEAQTYFKKLDRMGGMVAAIEKGFPQGEIHRAALDYQREIDDKKRLIVGLNAFEEKEETSLSILKISRAVERNQVKQLKKIKDSRNQKMVRNTLKRLTSAAKKGAHLMPFVLNAVRADATVGEITEIFRKIYGTYTEKSIF